MSFLPGRGTFLWLVASCGAPAAPPSVTLLPVPAASAPARVSNDRTPPRRWEPSERFRLGIEQHDVALPIIHHTVTVARAPFTLVFEMHGIEFIEVNASYGSSVLDRARSHASLEDTFGPGNGMAEEDPPPKGIFIRDDAFNYWGWDKDNHRCHAHIERDDESVCKRVIDVLREGAVTKWPLVSWRGDPVYFVVVAANDDGDEAQRDWLTVSFR